MSKKPRVGIALLLGFLVTSALANEDGSLTQRSEFPLYRPPDPPRLVVPAELSKVFFASKRSNLDPIAQDTIDKQIALLALRQELITLTGCAELQESKTKEAARRLAQKRATTVANYMIKHGIAAERIRLRSLGSDCVVIINPSSAAYAANRYVGLESLVRD